MNPRRRRHQRLRKRARIRADRARWEFADAVLRAANRSFALHLGPVLQFAGIT